MVCRLCIESCLRSSEFHHDNNTNPLLESSAQNINFGSSLCFENSFNRSVQFTLTLSSPINLRDLARRSWNVELDPRKNKGGLGLAIRNPRCNAVLFSTGTMNCVHALSSELEAATAARKLVRKVQKIYPSVRMQSFRIGNILASGALGFTLDLYTVSRDKKLSDQIEFDPDRFPGLHYRVPLEELEQREGMCRISYLSRYCFHQQLHFLCFD